MALKRLFVTLYRFVVVFFAVSGSYLLWTGAEVKDAIYFTDQTNLVLAVIFLWAGFATLLKGIQPPAWLKGCLTLYILVTGLVANIILPPTDPTTATYLYGMMTSTMLHVIVPIMAVVDFILFDPHRRYKWHYSLTWLIYFPIYLTFIIIRANLWPNSGPGYSGNPTSSYPYGFIDLSKLGWFGHDGHLGLAQNIGIYLGAFFILGLILFAIDRALPHRALVSTR
jgi:hypothetical protein